MHLVGAAALYQRVLVGLGGKFGLGRYNSISGRKSPLFDASRQIDTENFCQGFHSGLRLEMPRARDPRILVAAGGAYPTWEIDPAPRLARADLRVSRVRAKALYKFVH